MKLIIKQKMFNMWGESFNVQDENGNDIFQVKTSASALKRYYIKDMNDNILLILKKRYFRFLARWDVLSPEKELLFIIKQKFRPFFPKYKMVNVKPGLTGNYEVSGSFTDFNYNINKDGTPVAVMKKEWIKFVEGDCYILDITDPDEVLRALSMVIVFDATHHKKRSGVANLFD